MSDKLENTNVSEELLQIISQRLGERDRKLKRMHEMALAKKKRSLNVSVGVIVIAACMLGLFLFVPTSRVSPLDELNIQPNSVTFRSASPEITEINRLVASKKYSDALAKTEKALSQSDKTIMAFEGLNDNSDDEEEMNYEKQMEYYGNSELRWTYIYTLVQCDRNKDAINQLKIYLKRPEYCENVDEAKALLKLLLEKM